LKTEEGETMQHVITPWSLVEMIHPFSPSYSLIILCDMGGGPFILRHKKKETSILYGEQQFSEYAMIGNHGKVSFKVRFPLCVCSHSDNGQLKRSLLVFHCISS
jgi:hypothetical protein